MEDKNITLTNYEMEKACEILDDFLDRSDILGYAAARNIRRLHEASVDHEKRKNDLLNKYGKAVYDKDGNDTGQRKIGVDDENYDNVLNQLNVSGNIEHTITIFSISYSDILKLNDPLTGREIMNLEWMLTDD